MKKKLISSLLSAILLLSFVGGAIAGSPTAVISAGSGSGQPGDTNISVSVRLNSQDGAQVAGMNFDLSFDNDRLNVSNVSIGPAAISAEKTMSWSRPSSGTVRVIIFGLNQDAIPNGTVVNVIFNVLAGAAPGTSSLVLSNAAATDPSGSGIGVSLNNGSFTVLSPPATNTPTSAPTETPISTFTSTSSPTDTPIASYTSTIAPTVSPTPTMTPSIGPSPTGGPSATPTHTKTGIPSPSATSESKPTSSVTPTPNPTDNPEVTALPTGGSSASPTPPLEGETLSDHESAAEATGTAIAGLEAAVAATATALAKLGQESGAGVDAVSDPSNWLRQWGDVLLLGGVAVGATLLVTGLLFEVMRRRVSLEEKLAKKEERYL